jgi:hypothetical protein
VGIILIERPMTLGEFLVRKKPGTEPEILACLAYFLEKKAGKRVELTASEAVRHLTHTGYKIRDMSTAFIRARERKAYFERVGDDRPIVHRLTQTGAETVENLPKPSKKKR